MIQFNNVALQLGDKFLFTDISFTLHAKEKIGLIGQNGAGKSTLFAMLQGVIHPDKGEVQLPKNLRLATVKQETPALPMTAIEYVLDGDGIYRQQQKEIAQAEVSEDIHELGRLHEWMEHTGFYAKPAQAAALLNGLGFSFEEQSRPVAEFSGGWRMRLNLAQALIAPSDVLLLDEPTNHLDLEAVLWLEDWLKNYPGILLIISHDREFLDNVVKYILWLEQGVIKRFSGNYSEFEIQRATQLMQQQAALEKQQRERAHLQSYIDRFRAQATKARQAQSRIKALERMGEVLAMHQSSPFHFSFSEVMLTTRANLLQLIDADIGYENKTILEQVQFAIASGERLGLLGPNGAGKSTLIKSLAGTIPLLKGERKVNQHLKLGYFSQHQLDILVEKESPFWHFRELSPHAAEPTLRKFLGQFNFSGDNIFKPISYFSGGEKARLALALIIWQKPNLLLLDEPTNHLDIEMRQALILALQDYTGAVIVISHDRHLIRATTDVLYLVYQGRVEEFKGSIDDYPDWWKKEQKKHITPTAVTKKNNRKEEQRELAEQRALKQKYIKACENYEASLGRLQEKLSILSAQLQAPDLYEPGNKNKLTQLLKDQKQIQQEILVTEEALLQVMSQLEKDFLED
jgi:ATP-binding cassette subfamily F protein 3